MKTRFAFLLPFILLAALISLPSWPVQAYGQPQGAQYATPTPLPDGRIVYIVQPGDTCVRISLLSGLSVEQIIVLNRLDDTCSLQEGQQLLLGVGASVNASPTPIYAISPTPSAATPTAIDGTAEICVLVFNDENGDTLHQETEPSIIGAVIGITNAEKQFTATKTIDLVPAPDEFQGVCFEDVPEGHYAISAAIPDDYNATMPLNYELDAQAGDRIAIGFGAQARQNTYQEPASESRSPIFGLLGSLLLISGGVLLWYARQNTPSRAHTLR